MSYTSPHNLGTMEGTFPVLSFVVASLGFLPNGLYDEFEIFDVPENSDDAADMDLDDEKWWLGFQASDGTHYVLGWHEDGGEAHVWQTESLQAAVAEDNVPVWGLAESGSILEAFVVFAYDLREGKLNACPKKTLNLAQALALAVGFEVTRLNYTEIVNQERVYTIELKVSDRALVIQILEGHSHSPILGYSAAVIEVEPSSITSTELDDSVLTVARALTPEPLWDETDLTPAVRGVFTRKGKPVGILTDPADITILALYNTAKLVWSGLPSMSDFYCHLRREADTWLLLEKGSNN